MPRDRIRERMLQIDWAVAGFSTNILSRTYLPRHYIQIPDQPRDLHTSFLARNQFRMTGRPTLRLHHTHQCRETQPLFAYR